MQPGIYYGEQRAKHTHDNGAHEYEKPDTSPGPKQSVASVVGSPGVRGIFSRLTSRFTPARGEVSTNRTAARFAWGLWTLSVLLLLGYIPLRYLWYAVASAPPTTLPPQDIATLQINLLEVIHKVFAYCAILTYSTLGALIVSRARERRIGWLFCAIGLLFATGSFAEGYAVYTLLVVPGALPAGLAIGWIQHWIWIVETSLLLIFLPLLYPTGRLVSRHWKPVEYIAIGLVAGGTCLIAFAPGPLSNIFEDFQTKIPNPLGIVALGPVVEVIDPIDSLLFLLFPLVSASSLLLRLRQATGDERQQLKWFAYVAALLVVLFVTYNLSGFLSPVPVAAINIVFDLFYPLAGIGLPLLTGLAILKYHLYDIDRLINRTLAYGALTASVVGLYVLIVGALGALLQSSENPLITIVATGLVALLFHPMRERLQRAVNRLMYGQRDDPYAVLARLGQRLEGTLAPEAVLPTIVETIAQTLKLPFVAIVLTTQHQTPGAILDSQQLLVANDVMEIAATYGTPGPHPVKWPLVYQQEAVGYLLLGARAGEALGSADLRLLADLARQAGVAASAVRLTTDLQRLAADLQQARERLVTAREEERRRLRRDLHDGLGPALASLSFKVDAARNLLRRDPERAEAVLVGVTNQAQKAIADIRRLVYALRPPALDELGLVFALREQVAQHAEHEVQITIEAPERLPVLPAAVEVAAYRIAQEALTNVLRHANAQHCALRMYLTDGALCLEVADDGQGIPAQYRPGVGLRAMAERAAELGGSCTMTPGLASGTVVHARLPLLQESGLQHTVVAAPAQEG